MTASKQKGTGGETELMRLVNASGVMELRRMPASAMYDLGPVNPGETKHRDLPILATRPDRGRWLVTLDLNDFLDLLFNMYHGWYVPNVMVEVKRYKRFSLHSIFEKKFGRRT